MTKEQALEILRECVTSGRAITNGCHINDTEYEVLKIAVKALEQQSDDCVSRTDLYRILKLFGEQPLENDIATDLIYLVKDSDIVELPPVTPTHGTCKECGRLATDKDGDKYCELSGRYNLLNFYCADFEKRGVENDIHRKESI